MAAFIAKQMMGDQIKNVTGGDGGEGDKKVSDEDLEEAAAIEEARREMEEKRKEKHRKQEEEREEMRQGIRDKYGLKKKEVPKLQEPEEEPGMEGRLGRKKKTPAEMAAEAAKAEEEEENSFLPANVTELTSKVSELPGKVIAEASEKCVLQ